MISSAELREQGLATGAVAVGWTAADTVSSEARQMFLRYLSEGRFASMDYMGRHLSVRFDPRELLPDARMVISFAFSYAPGERRADHRIAMYAYGRDYHKELPGRLRPFCRYIERRYGAATRICVDSAPVMERYWAQRAGIGRCGRNGALIVPGYGSLCFLAEVITDAVVEPLDTASADICTGCGACVAACPTGALTHGGFDASWCLSYLTIEHRGAWNADINPAVVPLFGCDACLRACPYNRDLPPTAIAAFRLRPGVRDLSDDTIMTLSSESELAALLPASPIRRAGLTGLRRNISLMQRASTGFPELTMVQHDSS